MFNQKYEDRLQMWSVFRQSLETSVDPLQDVVANYGQAPTVSIHTDPYNKDTWPTPWELIQENQYCDFCIVLGQCYSLQLTERFKGVDFEIHISVDKEKAKDFYLLHTQERVIGYDKYKHVCKNELPKTIETQIKYPMPKIQ